MIEYKTGKCGCKIPIVERFKGIYCDDYCCKHCPDSKASSCQNTKRFGTPLENLAKLQIKNEEVDNINE